MPNEQVLENHKHYLERKKYFKSFGYDIDQERKFILDKAQPIFGDILEVGTGKGHFALALAQEGYRFMSIDISDDEQKIAKLNLEHFGLKDVIDFRIENAEKTSFKDGSFDVIFSINTLHHLERPYQVMNELTRILSLEGKMVLADFTKQGLELMDKIHSSEGRKHHSGDAQFSDIDRCLLARGFTVSRDRSKYQEILIAYNKLI